MRKIKYKARYVIGGHRDRLKGMIFHSFQALQLKSIFLLLDLETLSGFDLWTSDVRQGYLKASEPLMSEVLIGKPAPEFELETSECLKLLRPHYGLCESGGLWHATVDKHHREELGMKPLRSDPALYAMIGKGILRGLSGGCVDDLPCAVDSEFKNISKKTKELFDLAHDKI